ncbi:MAG TPA: aldehyde dehydrogenase family protein [Stenomitos sp.]
MIDTTKQPAAVRRLVSYNPATEEPLGEVPLAGPDEVARAVEAAHRAQPAWQALGFEGRARHLLRLRDALRDDAEAFSELLSQENGKPVPEAMGEVFSACEFLAYYARNAARFLKDQPIQVWNPILRNRKTYTTFVPKGVVGVISPWNYPLLLSMASISGALAAGNTVIHKPSEWTPLVAVHLDRLAKQAGLPEGVLSVLTGDGSTGAALVDAPIQHVCFTGSVATGKKVAGRCADKLITVTLELGGKDPALVLADAEIDFTAHGVVWGALSNTGQACASVERLYVDSAIAAPLTERIVELVKALKVGNGQETGTEVGPLINSSQLAKVEAQVADAVAKGAQVLVGGHRLDGKGYFYAPTVLTNVTDDMLLMREETFGPVLPILAVEGLEEMVARANHSSFGLNATVWGRDLAAAEQVAKRLEAGTVWVNTGLESFGNPVTQHGGLKDSGLGRVGGPIGLMEFVDDKLIDINRSGRYKVLWYPTWPGFKAFMAGSMQAMHGATLGKRLQGALQLLRNRPRR